MNKHQMAASFYQDAIKKFLWFVADSCQADIANVDPKQFIGYHRLHLSDEIQTRHDLADYFQAPLRRRRQRARHLPSLSRGPLSKGAAAALRIC